MQCLLLTLALLGQPAQPAGQVEFLHTEVDAAGWVLDAAVKYPDADRPFIRFAYLPPWADPEWHGVMDFAVNAAAGQTRTLHKADLHAGGWLMAWNLQRLAPDPKQLARLIATWDELAARDPVFHLPQVNLVEITTPGVDRFGRATQTTSKVSKNVVVLAPHLQAAMAKHATDPNRSERIDVLVTQLTQSSGAIYPADFLLEQLLSSLVGKYPEFRQIDFQSPEKDLTPLQFLLKKRGFFLEASTKLKADRGALLLVSDVTGKNRVVLAFYGLAGDRPAIVTFDIKDSRTRPDAKFIRNLIEFNAFADASEVFIPLPNGLVEYVLSDAKGNIQRSAPPDIVADSTKPDGHTKELEMGLSCVLCHSPQDGYKTARNDMEFLLGSDIDFFGDNLTFKNVAGVLVTLSRAEALDIVAGRYGERIDEPDGILGRARRDFIKATNLLTSYPVTADGPSSAQQLGAKVKSIQQGYRYGRIDARRAALELGVRVPADMDAKAVLRQLVPPPPAGEREDVLIALLRNGAAIKRDDMDAVYGEMARRAVVTRPALIEAMKGKP